MRRKCVIQKRCGYRSAVGTATRESVCTVLGAGTVTSGLLVVSRRGKIVRSSELLEEERGKEVGVVEAKRKIVSSNRT
jgi:hypothetical protein